MPALLEVDLWDRRKLFIINCDLGTEVAQLVKNPPLPADSILPDLLHILNLGAHYHSLSGDHTHTCT